MILCAGVRIPICGAEWAKHGRASCDTTRPQDFNAAWFHDGNRATPRGLAGNWKRLQAVGFVPQHALLGTGRHTHTKTLAAHDWPSTTGRLLLAAPSRPRKTDRPILAWPPLTAGRLLVAVLDWPSPAVRLLLAAYHMRLHLNEACVAASKQLTVYTCVHEYMYTFAHVCMHARLHVDACIYIYTCQHADVNTCVHAYPHTCTYMICVQVCSCNCVCIVSTCMFGCAFTYVSTHLRMDVQMYMCLCVHGCVYECAYVCV